MPNITSIDDGGSLFLFSWFVGCYIDVMFLCLNGCTYRLKNLYLVQLQQIRQCYSSNASKSKIPIDNNAKFQSLKNKNQILTSIFCLDCHMEPLWNVWLKKNITV